MGKRVVLLFLQHTLGNDMPWKFIDHHNECVEGLVKRIDASLDRNLKHMDRKKRFKTYHTLTLTKQLASMQADVERNVMKGAPSSGDILLLSRKGGSRSWIPDQEEKLINKLGKATSRRVVRFTGSESTLETVRAFAGAAGVVGYHGAGFANTIFNGRHVCVVEITTYKDVDCSDKTVWRSHPDLRTRGDKVPPVTINPHAAWQLYLLPLLPMLQANHAEDRTDCGPDVERNKLERLQGNFSKKDPPLEYMDQVVKQLKYITLKSADSTKVAKMMAE